MIAGAASQTAGLVMIVPRPPFALVPIAYFLIGMQHCLHSHGRRADATAFRYRMGSAVCVLQYLLCDPEEWRRKDQLFTRRLRQFN